MIIIVVHSGALWHKFCQWWEKVNHQYMWLCWRDKVCFMCGWVFSTTCVCVTSGVSLVTTDEWPNMEISETGSGYDTSNLLSSCDQKGERMVKSCFRDGDLFWWMIMNLHQWIIQNKTKNLNKTNKQGLWLLEFWLLELSSHVSFLHWWCSRKEEVLDEWQKFLQ